MINYSANEKSMIIHLTAGSVRKSLVICATCSYFLELLQEKKLILILKM